MANDIITDYIEWYGRFKYTCHKCFRVSFGAKANVTGYDERDLQRQRDLLDKARFMPIGWTGHPLDKTTRQYECHECLSPAGKSK